MVLDISEKKKKKISEYNRLYYERNKERLNKKKKERYLNDPYYREIIKKGVKLHYAIRKLANQKESMYEIKLNLNDREEKAYPQREACKRFNRDYSAVRRLIARGIIPNGKKIGRKYYYTESQILFLRDLFTAIDKDKADISYSDIKEYCNLVWDKPYVFGENPYLKLILSKGGKNERKARRSKKAVKFEKQLKEFRT